jgi:hypothetical protein
MISFVIGDSHTMPRAFANPPQQLQNIYPYKLIEKFKKGPHLLWLTPLLGYHRISDVAKSLNRELLGLGKQEYEMAIIHLGIVDCAPRPMPFILGRVVDSSPKYIKIATLHTVRKIRPYSQKIHYWQFTQLRKFKKIFDQILTTCNKTFKYTIVINIASAPGAIEAYSPGLNKEINRYNAAISQLSHERALLIDVYNHTLENTNEKITADLHLNEETHQWVFEQIEKIMSKRKLQQE